MAIVTAGRDRVATTGTRSCVPLTRLNWWPKVPDSIWRRETPQPQAQERGRRWLRGGPCPSSTQLDKKTGRLLPAFLFL